jgi:hypothetical protein
VLTTEARAEGTAAEECVAASERSVTLRTDHHLLSARAESLKCARASCPAEVREECTRVVDQLNRAIPTIAFYAKDAEGNDLTDVTVHMDGKELIDHLQGVSQPVDPGEHTFTFETEGFAPVEKKILIVESAKDRRESIVFGASGEKVPSEEAAGAPADRGNLQRILGYTAAGLGVAGLAVGTVFVLQRSSQLSQANGICPTGTCLVTPGGDPNQVAATNNAQIAKLTDDANRAGTIATAGFIAGGVLLAGGIGLVLTAPKTQERVALSPAVGPGFQGFVTTGRF